jgi:formylglycine-generating enzyme required for sulfatase activity
MLPVTISQPFYLGTYPVTQAQWEAVMGNNPSEFKGNPNCNDLQTVRHGLANKSSFQPAIRANKRGRGPTLGSWPLVVMWFDTTI